MNSREKSTNSYCTNSTSFILRKRSSIQYHTNSVFVSFTDNRDICIPAARSCHTFPSGMYGMSEASSLAFPLISSANPQPEPHATYALCHSASNYYSSSHSGCTQYSRIGINVSRFEQIVSSIVEFSREFIFRQKPQCNPEKSELNPNATISRKTASTFPGNKKI